MCGTPPRTFDKAGEAGARILAFLRKQARPFLLIRLAEKRAFPLEPVHDQHGKNRPIIFVVQFVTGGMVESALARIREGRPLRQG